MKSEDCTILRFRFTVEDTQSHDVSLPLKNEEWARMKQAARREGMTPAHWCIREIRDRIAAARRRPEVS